MVSRPFCHDEYYGAADREYDPFREDTINEHYSDGVPLALDGGEVRDRALPGRPPRSSVACAETADTAPYRRTR